MIAAIEQFLRDTAPPPAPPAEVENAWVRASRLEAVEREPRPSPGDAGACQRTAASGRPSRDAERDEGEAHSRVRARPRSGDRRQDLAPSGADAAPAGRAMQAGRASP